MKIVTASLYKKNCHTMMGSVKFSAMRHISLKGVNNLYTYFPYLLSDFCEFDTKEVHSKHTAIMSFEKNDKIKTRTLLTGGNKILAKVLHLSSDLNKIFAENLHILPLNIVFLSKKSVE
jgi:hypothetical protein